VVTHLLQVERRTAKALRPKTDALPLDHATTTATATYSLGHGLHTLTAVPLTAVPRSTQPSIIRETVK